MRLFIVLLLLPVFGYAQRNVRGTLIDSDTNLPISFATIYISGSTIGTSADSNGFFLLRSVPSFKTTLVVSAMGYEVFSKTLEAGEHGLELGDIRLNMRPEMLEEVSISPHSNFVREQRMKEFLDEFIGKTPNSKKTKLLNPEFVHTFLDMSTLKMSAKADRTLVFKNDALGYLINVDLELFEGSATQGYEIQGHYFFIPLSDNKAKVKQYEKARKEAYVHSFKRFLHQVFAPKPEWDAFEIFAFKHLQNQEKNRVSTLISAQEKEYLALGGGTRGDFQKYLQNYYHKDSIAYFAKVLEQASYFLEVDTIATSLLELVQKDGEIAYFIREGNYGVRFTKRQKNQKLPQFSKEHNLDAAMILRQNHIMLNSHGIFYPPLSITFGGVWSWNGRLADMLAQDYTPDTSN